MSSREVASLGDNVVQGRTRGQRVTPDPTNRPISPPATTSKNVKASNSDGGESEVSDSEAGSSVVLEAVGEEEEEEEEEEVSSSTSSSDSPSDSSSDSSSDSDSDSEVGVSEVGVAKMGITGGFEAEGSAILSCSKEWDNWEQATKYLMKTHGVWRYVYEPVIPKPKREDCTTEKEFMKMEDKWERRNAKAMTIILKTVSASIRTMLHKQEEASKCWQLLEKDFKPKGMMDEMDIFLRWDGLKYNGVNIEAFCRTFRNYLEDCKVVEMEIPPKIALYKFIKRIGHHFDHVAYEIRNQVRAAKSIAELPVLEDLITKIMDESKTDKGKGKALVAQQQMVAQQQKKQTPKPIQQETGPAPKTDQTVICTGCGREGWPENKCWFCHPELKKAYMIKKKPWKKPRNAAGSAQIAEETGMITLEMNTFDVTMNTFDKAAGLSTSDWVIDSGASNHYTNGEVMDPEPVDLSIKVGNSQTLQVIEKGTVKIHTIVEGVEHVLKVSNVYRVPGLVCNLLSTTQCLEKGIVYDVENWSLFHRRKGHKTVIATASRRNNIPLLDVVRTTDTNPSASQLISRAGAPTPAFVSSRSLGPAPAPLSIWHLRLGHLPRDQLKRMTDKITIIPKSEETPHRCDGCTQGAAKRLISRIPVERPESQLDELSIDTVHVNTPGIRGELYFVTITDGATLHRDVIAVETKGSIAVRVKEYLMANKPTLLRIDGGREFTRILPWCEENVTGAP